MDNLTTPKAIVIGAIIIAVVIVGGLSYQKKSFEKNLPAKVEQAIKDMQPDPSKMPPVTKDDHILGDIKAPVKFVTYTDFECPFCKTFHQYASELKNDYIKDGKVALVYRAFPLDGLHQKARPEAIATECAAKLGGNDKYWQYVDKIFSTTPSNDKLDLTLLPKFAKELGLDEKKFEACTKDKAVTDAIDKSIAGGTKAAAQGTPYILVVKGEKVMGALPGAMPADQLRKVVDQVTAQQ